MSSKTHAPSAPRETDVLKALDRAKTQWYHATAVIIAGMGFFTDAYDLFCISTVTKLLGRLYYYDPATGKPGVLPPVVYVSITGVALVGALVGQLFFGMMGDMFGRKKVYGITLVLMIACSLGSAMSFGHSAKAVMFTLCWFRFWLGVGIGGDYPLSATIMSEYSNTRTRGSFIAAVFAMQGFGILFGGVVAMAVSASLGALSTHTLAFNQDQILSTPPKTDFIWRIIFAVGAIPAAMTLYWRMKMPETARYTALVEGNLKQAAADMATVLNVEFQPDAEKEGEQHLKPSEQYGLWSREFTKRHGLHLVGTTVCWFMLDVAYYSQNLFQKDVLTAVGWLKKASTMHAAEEVFNIAQKQALLALFTTVPGYWFTVALIDKIGRFKIQLGGFFFMTVFMLAASIPYNTLRGQHCTSSDTGFCEGHVKIFVVLYGLTFFFSNFGPNSTTFIVPAEIFPARVRSTCHGISAAAGKLGAIVGSFGFLIAAQDSNPQYKDVGYKPGFGTRKSLIFMAGVNAVGLLFTFLVPETKGRSLEELSGEDEDMGIESSLPHSTTSAHNTGTKDTIFDSPRQEV